MDIARVGIRTTGFQGAPGVTVLHFRNRSGSSWSAITNQLITQCVNAFDTIRPMMPTSWHFEVEGSIPIINAETGNMIDTLTGTTVNHQGTSASAWGPSPSGIRVQYNTNGFHNGRRVRGATFLVPLHIFATDTDGTPTSTALGYAQAFGDSISSGSSYGQLVVYTRPVPPSADGIATDVTGATVRDTFAVLRSRRD